jgi:uncharacterized protein YlxP (DUF503 family)
MGMFPIAALPENCRAAVGGTAEGRAVPTCDLLLSHDWLGVTIYVAQDTSLRRTLLRRTLLRQTLLMIAFLTLELRIEAAHSLKDKRQVTRSLKDRLRSSFNIAVAELDPSLLWNQATIGVVSVSHSRDYLDGLMKNVERAATRIANNAGAEVTDSFVEFL